MPNLFRCATPMEDWRTFKTACDLSAGWEGSKTAGDADVLGDRHSCFYLVEDTIAAIIEDAAYTEEAVCAYAIEKVSVPKKTGTGELWVPGQAIYWDPATRLFTPVPVTGYIWAGIGTEPAGINDLYGEIDFLGLLGLVYA